MEARNAHVSSGTLVGAATPQPVPPPPTPRRAAAPSGKTPTSYGIPVPEYWALFPGLATCMATLPACISATWFPSVRSSAGSGATRCL